MAVQKYELNDSQWEYLDIELAYEADCAGDGGWILLTTNGSPVDGDTHELPYFIDYLNQFGDAGWELISIAGGPYVKLHYDYRSATFRKSVAAAGNQWEYLVFELKPQDNEWVLDRINDEVNRRQESWDQFLNEMKAEGWLAVKVPDHKPIRKYTSEAALKRLIPI
jgi:hypothetical protein